MSLQSLETQILNQISEAADEAALEVVRVAALGKKGSVSERMKSLGAMGPDERREVGAALNLLKDTLAAAIAARRQVLQERALEARLAGERIDVTLPARPQQQGTIHPVSQVWEEVVQIFGDLESVDYKKILAETLGALPPRQALAPPAGQRVDFAKHVTVPEIAYHRGEQGQAAAMTANNLLRRAVLFCIVSSKSCDLSRTNDNPVMACLAATTMCLALQILLAARVRAFAALSTRQ